MAFSVFFWALFEQAASSITLFTDRNVNIGNTFSAGMFQAFNPLFIVVFAPMFAYLWIFLGKRNLEPDPGIKFAIAILLVGIGFMALVVGAQFAGDDFKVSIFFSDHNVLISYIWRTLFVSRGAINGFQIIYQSYSWVNDGNVVPFKFAGRICLRFNCWDHVCT